MADERLVERRGLAWAHSVDVPRVAVELPPVAQLGADGAAEAAFVLGSVECEDGVAIVAHGEWREYKNCVPLWL